MSCKESGCPRVIGEQECRVCGKNYGAKRSEEE